MSGQQLVKGRVCPECGEPLEIVLNPTDSWMNDEQFESQKAGDYCCRKCKGKRGKSGFRYYWRNEL